MKIPPLTFLFVYILLVFLFAGIYYKMPNEFYHSTNKYEYSLLSDKYSIRKDFEKFIKISLKKTHGNKFIKNDSFYLDIDSIKIIDFTIDENRIKFRLNTWFLNEYYLKVRMASRDFYFDLNSTEKFDTALENIVVYSPLICSSDFNLPFFPMTAKEIFNVKINGHIYYIECQSCDCGIGYISKEINNRLWGYKTALDGFPSYTSGSYLRMLYFSTITITTLGYGDIVPISGTSRFFVALEAILGIIIIGLYLNALANKLKPK